MSMGLFTETVSSETTKDHDLKQNPYRFCFISLAFAKALPTVSKRDLTRIVSHENIGEKAFSNGDIPLEDNSESNEWVINSFSVI
jgi:hypothetical protein